MTRPFSSSLFCYYFCRPTTREPWLVSTEQRLHADTRSCPRAHVAYKPHQGKYAAICTWLIDDGCTIPDGVFWQPAWCGRIVSFLVTSMHICVGPPVQNTHKNHLDGDGFVFFMLNHNSQRLFKTLVVRRINAVGESRPICSMLRGKCACIEPGQSLAICR